MECSTRKSKFKLKTNYNKYLYYLRKGKFQAWRGNINLISLYERSVIHCRVNNGKIILYRMKVKNKLQWLDTWYGGQRIENHDREIVYRNIVRKKMTICCLKSTFTISMSC